MEEVVKKQRAPLSRERVLRAAVALADERGIEQLSMRKLGQELGVEAMSLYNHVSNKEDILNGLVEAVAGEIVAAVQGIEPGADARTEWKGVARRRMLAAREVMLRHRWAPAVFESRTGIPQPLLGYYDSLLGLLRQGGMSLDLAHHAMHALGSRAIGFSQELFMKDGDDPDPQTMSAMIMQMGAHYPDLADLLKIVVHDPDSTLGGCDDQFEFEFGLDLLLDGLERLRDAQWRSSEAA